MRDFLAHLFFPRQSNNYRSRLLHHKSILLCILFLFVGQFSLFSLNRSYPSVLGTSIDISSQQLLLLTNQKRQKVGLPPLILSNDLSNVAHLKAEDMFERNYWAHNAPDGTTPWQFFRQVGYDYTYAGENLARGFTSSKDVVNAWMASASHRENMLSQNYTEIGFFVMEGTLSGEKTVLVVETLGNKGSPTIAQKEQNMYPLVASLKTEPIVNRGLLVGAIAVAISALFISVFVLDMIIVRRKNIARIAGHSFDHIFFFIVIVVIIFMVGKGVIL